MSFSEIQHQQQAVDALQGAMRSNRLPHAYIFCGPPGVGKALTARALARFLLCDAPLVDQPTGHADACGRCRQCQLSDHQSHPDLTVYRKPATAALFPIDMVTRRPSSADTPTINESVQYTPMQAARRVTIIDDAELMTESAANAFLKTFEEAPEGSYLILLVTSLDRLLPTIRSRGRLVRFRALPAEFVAQLLLEQGVPEYSADPSASDDGAGDDEDSSDDDMPTDSAVPVPAKARGRASARKSSAVAGKRGATAAAGGASAVAVMAVSAAEAEVLAHWSDGSIAQARNLALCGFVELRDQVMKALQGLDYIAALELSEVIDKWSTGQAVDRIQTKASVEKNTYKRQYLKLALALLASVFRDALVLAHEGPESLVMNTDADDLLAAIAENVAPAELETIIARLLECQSLVDRNAHIQLLLENACLDVAGALEAVRRRVR